MMSICISTEQSITEAVKHSSDLRAGSSSRPFMFWRSLDLVHGPPVRMSKKIAPQPVRDASEARRKSGQERRIASPDGKSASDCWISLCHVAETYFLLYNPIQLFSSHRSISSLVHSLTSGTCHWTSLISLYFVWVYLYILYSLPFVTYLIW